MSGGQDWGQSNGKQPVAGPQFFEVRGPGSSAQVEVVSMGLSSALLKCVRGAGNTLQAVGCADPLHLAKLVCEAVDDVRRCLLRNSP